MKHGLCARKFLMLPQEDAVAFAALETALLAELAPVGSLQAVLAQRVVSAAWRLARADRMEAEALAWRRCERQRPRARRDPRRQRHQQLRDRDALPQRRAGRAPARARHPPGAPGRRPGPPTSPRRPSAAAAHIPSRHETNPAKPAGSTGRPARSRPMRRPTRPRATTNAVPAPSPTAPPEAKRTPEVAPKQRLDLPAPGRSPHTARDRDVAHEAAPGSPVAMTKQTRGSAPEQRLGSQATC